VEQCTWKELQEYRLLDSGERIPLLDEVLELVKGQVPLVIEIKPEGDCRETAKVLAARMEHYEGNYCVESFHPVAIAWYRFRAPEVIRGQLADIHKKKDVDQPWIGRFVLTNLLFNGCTKPDFIAYNHRHVNQFSFRLCRKLFHVESAAWTIRSEKELEKARKNFQIFIFDGFLP
jgi:glycerophosphoryl diester phosphodiesterase